jgi:hypothetical protein
MRAISIRRLIALSSATLVAACETDSLTRIERGGSEPHFQKFAKSEWSEPVKLDPPISLPGTMEQGPALSRDGLTLYITSNRPGGLGGTDIWVSHRDCEGCSWRDPVNLGPPINSSAGDGQPTFSSDGRVMIFNSARPGGEGGADLYVSRREDPNDDFGWGLPVNLGTAVNTSDNDAGAEYVERELGHDAVLYFNRGLIAQQRGDIYAAPITQDGKVLENAAAVSELNDPTVNEGGLTVRSDGREAIFWSNRNSPAGTVEGDLFVSTRANVHDRWSTPERLGSSVNSQEWDEIAANLSHDGRSMLIVRTLPGGVGGTDIWVSTRTPSGQALER